LLGLAGLFQRRSGNHCAGALLLWRFKLKLLMREGRNKLDHKNIATSGIVQVNPNDNL
jgi:hypothetical protein